MQSEKQRGKIMLVFGTRPDAVKMCPLVNELKSRGRHNVITALTGQHREMLSAVLDVFGVVPDYDLAVMRPSQTPADVTSDILNGLTPILKNENPDLVLIHGDTTTALAAALACFYLNIPVGHVEAGLRTYNLSAPFPEEFNRQAAGIIARIHFAPTAAAASNLLREGKDADTVFVTGNTVIDAMRTTVRSGFTHPLIDAAAGRRIVLMTAHRRENQGEILRGIFRAVRRVTQEHPDIMVIYPVHKNPAVKSDAVRELDGCPGIILTEPLGLVEFHNIMARSFLVLTDSGGIQEEAPAMGVPVLVLRESTERPEGVSAGVLRLSGTDEENVYRDFTTLLDNSLEYAKMRRAVNPYGDGFASKRIADIIERVYGI